MKTMIIAAALALLGGAEMAVAAEPADGSGRKLMADLTAAAEVPGPGYGDGGGHFMARINPGKGQLCYTLTSTNLSTVTMAHIHSGASGVAGPPVVTLEADAPKETCLTIAKDLAQQLIQNPEGYYVNIHTSDFADGAVRGQLTK